ncbi:MAG: 16S rRNA (uracil(1498)-N(3))-methyltransferase [Pseudomonadota bacterium]
MARYRFRTQRLYVDHPLTVGADLVLDKAQSNYLLNVLRLADGAAILVFNGRDGEFEAKVTVPSKKVAGLVIGDQLRPQPHLSHLEYCFAPLKQARLDYMIQKAVEMGAGTLRPVLTQHTQVQRVNLERMRANAIEAAEQCGILAIPDVSEPVRLDAFLSDFPKMAADGRRLIFCDEGNENDDPAEILKPLKGSPISVLIGPEGGFSDEERSLLKSLPFVVSIPLGPRILRADTAAIAALALIQSTIGDWVASSH